MYQNILTYCYMVGMTHNIIGNIYNVSNVDTYVDTEDRGVENIYHCIHVRIDTPDIGIYQSILTYCYMAGMTHNMNQPMEIDTNVLYVSLVSCYLFGNGEW